MTITFFGHGSMYYNDNIENLVAETIKKHIDADKKTTFLCGGYGDFDNMCANICRQLKKDYPLIEVVYVTPYISTAQQRKIKELIEYKLYDSTLYPPIEKVPYRYAIIKRNEWMAENADLLIVYVKHEHGGAYNVFRHAKKKGKTIINIADFI